MNPLIIDDFKHILYIIRDNYPDDDEFDEDEVYE